MSRLFTIHPDDNVAVDIDTGFKKALKDIPAGSTIIKYGNPIGAAVRDISAGETVHTDNMKTLLTEKVEYAFHGPMAAKPVIDTGETFLGYRRANGTVGTRNELWIIPTVGCVNNVAEQLAAECGGYAYPHPYGCSQLGDDHEVTRLILRGLCLNPNAGGVLVVGLGCENNTMKAFRELLGQAQPDHDRIRFLVCQDVEDEIEEGKRLIQELKDQMCRDERVPCPVLALRIGLKCGGSDGYSGITANPLLGRFTDRLISAGGGAILTEVPEMFGAEKLLMDRAVSEEVFRDIVTLINGYKSYFTSHGQVVYENPSPGNKAGGITTLEEKSLGCTQKSGSSPVMGVLKYGDRIQDRGLYLLEGPGNDIVACTNLAAAGCNLILFTTGRGTPLGSPEPTVKVASNHALAVKKKNWIDFDAGLLLDETISQAEIDNAFWNHVLAIADGAKTKNELNGNRAIAIFKDGVTL